MIELNTITKVRYTLNVAIVLSKDTIISYVLELFPSKKISQLVRLSCNVTPTVLSL